MSDGSAACWQGVIQALHNDPRALLALLQVCRHHRLLLLSPARTDLPGCCCCLAGPKYRVQVLHMPQICSLRDVLTCLRMPGSHWVFLLLAVTT